MYIWSRMSNSSLILTYRQKFLNNIKKIKFVYMCHGVHVAIHKLALSFHHVGPEDWAQVAKFGNKDLYTTEASPRFL